MAAWACFYGLHFQTNGVSRASAGLPLQKPTPRHLGRGATAVDTLAPESRAPRAAVRVGIAQSCSLGQCSTPQLDLIAKPSGPAPKPPPGGHLSSFVAFAVREQEGRHRSRSPAKQPQRGHCSWPQGTLTRAQARWQATAVCDGSAGWSGAWGQGPPRAAQCAGAHARGERDGSPWHPQLPREACPRHEPAAGPRQWGVGSCPAAVGGSAEQRRGSCAPLAAAHSAPPLAPPPLRPHPLRRTTRARAFCSLRRPLQRGSTPP